MESPPRKVGIRIAGNTLIPTLQVIAAKGYAITHYYCEPDRPFWDADKDGRSFSADSAEALLGLIAMWEQRGDDWMMRDGESALLDRVLASAVTYDADGNVVEP